MKPPPYIIQASLTQEQTNLCPFASKTELQIFTVPLAHCFNMSGAEAEEGQSTFEDGGQGPGAPTPLSVLEVRIST